jgi:hypothetical protein
MASTISAQTSGAGGISMTGDASGILNLNSNGTNVVAVSSTGMAVTGTLAATGAVSGTTGTFTSTLGVTGAITGSSTVAGSTGILYPLTSGTAVASTSGTSIDFTSIPSWVKRITVMIAGMSTNGTSEYVLRIGDSATISATGYVGAYATNAVAAASTTGFGFGNGSSATATIVSGSFVLTTLDVATFKWTCIGMLGESDTVRMTYSAGSKTLAGALTNVRVTTLNGTDTFDAGSINILYE